MTTTRTSTRQSPARQNPTEQQAAAQATKPTYQVINDVLYYQAKAGDELRIDLDFPGAVLDKLFDASDGEEIPPRQQLILVLEALGDQAMITRIKKMGALEQTRLVTQFFALFAEAAEAEPGKSDGSADS